MCSLQDFEILQQVGEGSFGKVFKVKKIDIQQIFALKQILFQHLSEKERESALNEVRLLASIRHPNIIAYKEAFFDVPSMTLNIVMEFAAGGSLTDYIDNMKKKGEYITSDKCWNYICQMLNALKSLHDKQIAHRDIKSANIFLNEDFSSIKIGDFNVSKIMQKGLLYTKIGTPYYSSPELWTQESYNSKSDIWSIGCVIYELLSQKLPFYANDIPSLFFQITKGEFKPIPIQYGVQLQKFVKLCLEKDVVKRPNCDILLQIVQNHLKKNTLDQSIILEQKFKQPLLLKTIKMPKNIHHLSCMDLLPKPDYESMISISQNSQLPKIIPINVVLNHERDQSPQNHLIKLQMKRHKPISQIPYQFSKIRQNRSPSNNENSFDFKQDKYIYDSKYPNIQKNRSPNGEMATNINNKFDFDFKKNQENVQNTKFPMRQRNRSPISVLHSEVNCNILHQRNQQNHENHKYLNQISISNKDDLIIQPKFLRQRSPPQDSINESQHKFLRQRNPSSQDDNQSKFILQKSPSQNQLNIDKSRILRQKSPIQNDILNQNDNKFQMQRSPSKEILQNKLIPYRVTFKKRVASKDNISQYYQIKNEEQNVSINIKQNIPYILKQRVHSRDYEQYQPQKFTLKKNLHNQDFDETPQKLKRSRSFGLNYLKNCSKQLF